MKRVLNEIAKIIIAFSLLVLYVWFVVSFAWSKEDMTSLEKFIGVVYGFAVIPLYEVLTRVFKLR